MRKTIWPGRRASMALGTTLVLVASSFALSATSWATHPEVSLSGSTFEIDTDANLKVDDAPTSTAPSIDWASVTEMRHEDSPSGSSDNSFGQGTKEDTAVPSVVMGGIPPNKSDLKWFGLYQEGTTSTGFLNLFWSRVQDPSGTTNMDFEFNQAAAPSNHNPPARTEGDLLITYDLSKGGTHPGLSLRTWTGSVWGPAHPLADSVAAAGSINTSSIPVADSGGLGAHTPRTFGEAQVALSEIFTAGSGCTSFGSAYLKSRASDSFTAALKDFISPMGITLTNCGSVLIHKHDTTATGAALAGATFTLYTDNDPFGVSRGDATADPVTDPALECTTADGSGDTTLGDCTISDIPFGQYWVVETGAPDGGFLLADDQHVNLTPLAATDALTFLDAHNPSSLAIHKQDDAGNPLDGVVFTLWTDTDPSDLDTAHDAASDTESPTLTCTTGVGEPAENFVGTGDCIISGILIPGQYWVVEGTPPTGYAGAADQPVNIAAGSDTDDNSLTFTNARNFKVIVLVCNQADGKLYPSTVTIGTSVTTSLDSDGASGANLSESDLCGLDAAASGTAGTYSGNVVISSTP